MAAGITAPGRALRGEPVTSGDMLGTAGLAVTGSLPMKALAAPNSMASRTANLYNLPTKSEVGDALGRSGSGGLDLEGRPLVARYVVGRTPDSEVERAINPAVLNEIAERFTGRPVEAVPKGALPRGSVGAVTRTGRGSLANPRVWSGLTPDQFSRTSAHEVSHILDYAAGDIPTTGLIKEELGPLYHYGRKADQFNGHKLELPRTDGYLPYQYREEYIAEAIRQYMVAPDTMKARYPQVAARIREYVNSNPKIMDLIQFNAWAVPAGGVAAGLLTGLDPSLEDDTRTYLGAISGQ